MRKYEILILMILFSIALGDSVVWDYDLTFLPEGWSADSDWNFDSYGAELDIYTSAPYGYEDGDLFTEWIMIPDNCDSIVLHVQQDLFAFYSGEGFASAFLKYRNNDMEWHWLSIGAPITTDPIHVTVPPYSGQGLSFWFHGNVGGGSYNNYGSGTVEWKLHDLTLTFYGDNMELESTTWASIKKLH
ncbi:MAG: hypothetical protein KAW14_11560 [Candidatus Aegiribacteria sp.]|nr:hypothetical protein [Candidatus Aegiribacteria sp.]